MMEALCRHIAAEEDTTKFMVLVQEPSDLLERKEQRRETPS